MMEADEKMDAEKDNNFRGQFESSKSNKSWISLNLKDKEELQDDEDARFSEDCYSYIALGCGEGNRLPFAYGMFVFIFQITFLVLMICSKMVRTMSANEDIDNAMKDDPNSVFATFIPAGSSLIVKTTQYVAITAFVFFAEDSVNDVVDGVRYLPLPFWTGDKIWVSVACLLRFIQGLFACYTAWLLVMVSSDVIDIILNFTAVNFISSLDDGAFEIASSGRYGDILKKKSEDISENIVLDYKCLHQLRDQPVTKIDEHGEETIENRDMKYSWYLPTLGVVASLLLGFTIYLSNSQASNEKWVAQVVRVEFDDDSGLIGYSGCYDFVGRNADRRPKYSSRDDNAKLGELEYCQADRRWVFIEEGGNVCEPHYVGKHLAQSSKTNSFDVSTAFELSWVSPFKKPLDMYFIDSTLESELFCTEFQANGICNDNLNKKDFKWDGGDCCGTTCYNPSCGLVTYTTAFGQELRDSETVFVDFPNCGNDILVNVTVELDTYEFPEGSDGVLKEFWNPTLKLACGEEKLTVFKIPISQSMFGEKHTVKVDFTTHCNLAVVNFEPYFDSFGRAFSLPQFISIDIQNQTEVFVDVVVENSIYNEFESLAGYTSLDLSGNFTLKGTIPVEIGTFASLEQLVLSNNELSGHVPKEIASLANLTNLDLSSNVLSGGIPVELTSMADLTVLSLGNNFLKGTIPTQIGLMKELITLDLRNNELTGLVPTEILSLPKLKFLFLDGNKLKGYVDCSVFPDIWDLELCQSINSFPRWDSEQPTSSPYPSMAPSVSNAPSVSFKPTVTAQPISFDAVTPMPTDSPSSPPSDPPPDCYSIADILCQENEFVQMCELMRVVENAEEMLSDVNATFTLFAPTNVGLSRYYTDNGVKFNFEEVFWFHAVEGEIIFKEDLPCDTGLNLIEMANGRDSRTLCDKFDQPIGQKGFGNDLPIPYVAFDMIACNGVIHTISDVLLSPNSID